jgi:CRISPR-associated protein Cmr2
MALARQTGELWGSSYLFSHIARLTLDFMAEERQKQNVAPMDVIIPYYKPESHDGLSQDHSYHFGYSDRIIWRYEEGDLDRFQRSKERIYEEIVTSMMGYSRDDSIYYKLLTELKFNLQLYAAQVEAEPEHCLKQVNLVLDALELHPNYESEKQIFGKDHDYEYHFFNFFQNRALKASNFFEGIKNEIIDGTYFVNKDWHFPSVNDIANGPYREYELEDACKCSGDSSTLKIRKSSHYYAVVQADGDGLGKLLTDSPISPDLDGKVKAVSEQLLSFSLMAKDLVREHKGLLIYAGGDDLLFFSPVEYCNGNNDKGNLIVLIEAIKNLFSEKMDNTYINWDEDEIPKPTLSFGVSIVYRKHPLYEALKEAQDQLFHVAKRSFKSSKDRTAIKLIAHSGQASQFVIRNTDQKTWEFLKKCTFWNKQDEQVMSLQHKVLQHKEVINGMLKQESEHFKTMFDHFILNNYNELDQSDARMNYILEVAEILKEIRQGYLELDREQQTDLNKEIVLAWHQFLRFVRFIYEVEFRDYDKLLTEMRGEQQ